MGKSSNLGVEEEEYLMTKTATTRMNHDAHGTKARETHSLGSGLVKYLIHHLAPQATRAGWRSDGGRARGKARGRERERD